MALSQIHAIYEEVLHSPVPLTLSSQFILQFRRNIWYKKHAKPYQAEFFQTLSFQTWLDFFNINVPTAVVTNAWQEIKNIEKLNIV